MFWQNEHVSQLAPVQWLNSILSKMLKDLLVLWKYQGLIRSLVFRDLRIKYKSSFLGFFWSLLHPLLMMAVYALIFSILIRMKVEGPYAIFLLAGILPWLFFASSLTLTAPSLLSNSSLINKVFFPREILPLAIIFSNLVNFLLSIVVFLIFMLIFGLYPGATLIWLPGLIFLHLLFTIGLSLLIATANVFFRDVSHVIDIVLQLWFFSVPIIYTVDFLMDKIGWHWIMLYRLNPMVPFIEMYRSIMMYSRLPGLSSWLYVTLISVITFMIGYGVFKRLEFDMVKEI
ncbi:ABC transporter permease [candidate division CSSED10-310 bacterium]|uniref:Transport permease protein n=1 Tax=candidate division CSSED10-310 bacterium TaxID=2855610 RepID=A0ABV6Z1N8_UNCC1